MDMSMGTEGTTRLFGKAQKTPLVLRQLYCRRRPALEFYSNKLTAMTEWSFKT